MENKKVAFITLGCKVNQYETNAMCEKFINKGYEVVEKEEKADIYIVNTCTVTNMSDRKSRQMLRRVKEINEKAIIVACGCYAQVAKEELEKIDEIDIVLGNNEKKNIVDYVEKYIKEKNKIIEIEDVMQKRDFVDFGEVTYTEKTRAVIKVQDGCDRFCSYCIIPYVRGRIRSRSEEAVIAEVTELAESGIKEVVLTGIHISSYGKDKNNEGALIDLIDAISKIKGIKRIRLGSLEPGIITEDFVRRVSANKKVCPHFHLSLQSGCNTILKRMNRKYTREQYFEKCEMLREAYDAPALTTDVIVGFPGETDEEFEETVQYLTKLNLYEMHIFKYSPRKGTVAAAMKDQVSPEVKNKRSDVLLELAERGKKAYEAKYEDAELEVLVEEVLHREDGTYLRGHTERYMDILIKAGDISMPESFVNSFVYVRYTQNGDILMV